MRLRLDSLQLRCTDHDIARADRLCQLCRMRRTARLEDERHILLECPRYKRLRMMPLWQPLFLDGRHTDMHAFMSQKDQVKLCHFVSAVLKRRTYLLELVREHARLDFYDSSDEDDTDA